MPPTDYPHPDSILRQQESLRTIIELISSELDLSSLLSRIVLYACELLGATRGSIGLVDKNRQIIRMEAVYNMPAGELGAEQEIGVGLAGHVLQTRQAVLLENYADLNRPIYPNMGADTVIGLPIIWREEMIGFFGIGAPPPHRFTQWHLDTLTLFARHAAIAIINAQLFTATQKTLQETQMLYETSRDISTAMDVDNVILAYLKQVAARGKYTCNVALYEFNDHEERVSVRVHGRWSPEKGFEYPQEVYPYSPDALDPVLERGETVVIENIFTDSHAPESLRNIQKKSGRAGLAMIPLMVRGTRIGLVILSVPNNPNWNEDVLRPYKVTAAQLEMAIDSRQQHQLLLTRNHQVSILEERRRLAYELHDSVTHLMFSITLMAQSIAPAWRRSPEEGEERIKRLLEISQLAMAEMRALLTELRPSENSLADAGTYRPSLESLKRYGLVGAINRHIADLLRDSLHIEFQVMHYTQQALRYEEALYRIIQEALNNVIKHAQASQVYITLSITNAIINLSIADNGVGFILKNTGSRSPSSSTSQTHLGLSTMQKRAEAVGGSLRLITAPNSGTTIEITVPIVAL